MAKLGRKTAGERVLTLAQAFSDDLLVDEERVFEAMDLVFAGPVPALVRATQGAIRRVTGDLQRLRYDADLMDRMITDQQSVIALCQPLVNALGETAARKARASMLRELTVCEQTLAARYAGIAQDAVIASESVADQVLQAGATGYLSAQLRASAGFEQDARMQMTEADDPDHLLKRLFSAEPAGLRGFQGRGVWWRAVSSLKAGAREVSTLVASMTREASMMAFNEIGRSR